MSEPRAVIYRVHVKGGKVITATFDYALGEHDPGENQARSNMYAAALGAGIDLQDIDFATFERREIS